MLPSRQKRPPPPTLDVKRLSAPIGGTNTIDAGSAMPPTDCVYAYNLIAAEYGLRSRLGYQEWCLGVTGVEDDTVRTTMGFSGGRKNGSTDRLFVCTQAGIYDVTTSTATQPVTFPTQSGDAGYGVYTVATTPGGRFLLYCDEENGLYVYTEATDTWEAIALGVTQLWETNTGYLVGDSIQNGGNVYIATTGGVSDASSSGPSGTGSGIGDGTVVWNYVSAAPVHAIGPSLADSQNGLSGSPANFVFVTVFKSRVWFVEKDSTRAWYLDVNAVFGTATSFNFGSKMRAGGPLVGLYNWSYDGGNGLDTLLAGISSAGDVVIYQGTDPASANTFGLKGVWSVGGVPYGRRIATDYGGDVLVLSLLGVVPLSRLVLGMPLVESKEYATYKISNLFNRLVSTYKSLRGWALCLHPTDNALLLLVPTQEGQPTVQLAFSFATKGWTQYRGLPIVSAGVWNGELYFGTADRRVCVNRGYVDNVLLSDASSFTPVQYSLLTAYQNLGNARNKRVALVRPIMLSEGPAPLVQAVAKFDFNLLEGAPPAGGGTNAAGTWDNATWDTDVWAGEYAPSQPLQGASGMGRDVAIAVQGSAVTRTTLVAVDVFYTQGGVL